MNKPEKEGLEYGKYIFNSKPDAVCSVDSNQKVNQEFEIDGIKYYLDLEHEDDLSLPDTTIKPQIQGPPQCKLDMDEVKQLQGQDPHLSESIVKCTSHSHHDKKTYYLDENGIAYRKIQGWIKHLLSHNGPTKITTLHTI